LHSFYGHSFPSVLLQKLYIVFMNVVNKLLYCTVCLCVHCRNTVQSQLNRLVEKKKHVRLSGSITRDTIIKRCVRAVQKFYKLTERLLNIRYVPDSSTVIYSNKDRGVHSRLNIMQTITCLKLLSSVRLRIPLNIG
jgi:hypothetical protein